MIACDRCKKWEHLICRGYSRNPPSEHPHSCYNCSDETITSRQDLMVCVYVCIYIYKYLWLKYISHRFFVMLEGSFTI